MGLFKGGALRLFQVALYLLAFLCAGIILGIYSYFLSVNADNDKHISSREKAIEGISGIAVVYTFFAFFLTCCLGGVTFFGIIGLILDLLFCAGMIAIAVLDRHAIQKCKGYVTTPIGSGKATKDQEFSQGVVYQVKLGLACRLNLAVFAVAIIGAFLFLVTALMQIALIKNHKKEKRYGPGPNNDYTSGSGKKRGGIFSRKNKTSKSNEKRDAELGLGAAAVGAGGLAAYHHHENERASHDTRYTGSTVANNTNESNKVDGTHSGYHTQPTGTGVNPYGYTGATANY